MYTMHREKAEREFRKTTRIILSVEVGWLLIIAAVVALVQRIYAPFRGFYPFAQMELLRYILLAVVVVELAVPRLLRFIPKTSPTADWERLILQLRVEAFRDYAICSSFATYGLVLFLVGGLASDCYLFMGLSVVGFWLYFPRIERWEQHLAKAEQEQSPAQKLLPSRERMIVNIVLAVGLVLSAIGQIRECQTGDLKEQARQEALRPTLVPKEKNSAPAVTKREEGKDTIDVIPALGAKVTSLRFFESGYHRPARGQRIYADRFQSDDCRYINWELNLTHPTRDKRVDFRIDAIWYNQDGSVLARQSTPCHLEESWCWSFWNHSWGWEEPAKWIPGQYRVELFVNGSKIAVGSFTVT